MKVKELADIVQSLTTTVGIVVGGIWTYDLFIKERQAYPHANIELNLSSVKLSGAANLLRTEIDITNIGSSEMFIENGMIWIQQILPIPPCPIDGPCAATEVDSAIKTTDRQNDRFTWPLIAERVVNLKQDKDVIHLEPGEKQPLEYEFAVSTDISVVRVYSYFDNDSIKKNHQIGWTAYSYYDFRNPKGGGTK